MIRARGSGMRYGIYLPNFGYCGDARLLAELAHEAEAAGWDGFFLWDHIRFPHMEPHADPWIALAAIAMRTERMRIGRTVSLGYDKVRFVGPVRFGDTITTHYTITALNPEKRRVIAEVKCINQRGEVVAAALNIRAYVD